MSSQDWAIKKGQVRTGRFRTGQVGSGQVGIGQHGTGQVKTNQVKKAEVRTRQVRTGKVRTDQVKSGLVKSTQYRTRQFGTCQIKLGQVEIGQVIKMKTYTWNSSVALLSPTCFPFLWHFFFIIAPLSTQAEQKANLGTALAPACFWYTCVHIPIFQWGSLLSRRSRSKWTQ